MVRSPPCLDCSGQTRQDSWLSLATKPLNLTRQRSDPCLPPRLYLQFLVWQTCSQEAVGHNPPGTSATFFQVSNVKQYRVVKHADVSKYINHHCSPPLRFSVCQNSERHFPHPTVDTMSSFPSVGPKLHAVNTCSNLKGSESSTNSVTGSISRCTDACRSPLPASEVKPGQSSSRRPKQGHVRMRSSEPQTGLVKIPERLRISVNIVRQLVDWYVLGMARLGTVRTPAAGPSTLIGGCGRIVDERADTGDCRRCAGCRFLLAITLALRASCRVPVPERLRGVLPGVYIGSGRRKQLWIDRWTVALLMLFLLVVRTRWELLLVLLRVGWIGRLRCVAVHVTGLHRWHVDALRMWRWQSAGVAQRRRCSVESRK